MPATDEIRVWHFSFGYGQVFRAVTSGGHGSGTGIPLDNCVVRITGTQMAARAKMQELFGYCWCDQYNELPVIPGEPWIDITGFMILAFHTARVQYRLAAIPSIGAGPEGPYGYCKCGWEGETRESDVAALADINGHISAATIMADSPAEQPAS